MYENLVGQEASKSLISDIQHNLLPGAVLFSGPQSTGKLTAALETSRILSCNEKVKSFKCNCPSCLQHKALTTSNLMLLGPRDCFLEIASSKKTFISAFSENAAYLTAARYLFLRSIRKLTLRFNPILLQGETNINKIASIIDEINEDLEKIDINHELPQKEELVKICDNLEKNAAKLESDYLYDSIPINQIRNMEEWAHIKADEGKKIVIIENADRMQLSVRNAMLKILEEPPLDCLFILLTSKKNAMMQTILSRLRVYDFKERPADIQKEVISRVFHNIEFSGSINDFLLEFLPVVPSEIKAQSDLFFNTIRNRKIPDCAEIVKKCNSFYPRIELKIFLNQIALNLKPLRNSSSGCEVTAKIMEMLRETWDNINLYNQSPVSALEILLKNISSVNMMNQGILCDHM